MSVLISIICIYLAIGLGVGITYHMLMNHVAETFEEDIPEFNINHVKFIIHTMVAWPWLIRDISGDEDEEDC
jgi:uncharacterized protein YneF (UPF0154 family)